ncbi:MAG: hypothetical protein Q9209_004650 [Squamulea sp. 1 TL-2023]
MTNDLEDEVEVINSIYGENTLHKETNVTSEAYLLAIPRKDVTLRLSIPNQYPDICLQITAVDNVGSVARKGFGNHVLNIAREVLQTIFEPGQVCIFDLLQEFEQKLDHEAAANDEQQTDSFHANLEDEKGSQGDVSSQTDPAKGIIAPPKWSLSTTVTEKKSIFLARACTIQSTLEAQAAISHLLSTDKRVGKATHNISAYRVRTLVNGHEVIHQDCDDDGEDAAGGRLLKLMQMMDVWNVLVVVSRWYGGVKLGPARFGIINAAAREALVSGAFTTASQPPR